MQCIDRKGKSEAADDKFNRKPTYSTTETNAVAKPEHRVNEIIWAKIKGFAHWPAKIAKISSTANGNIFYEVVWYNDYRRTKIYKLQVFKFFENFEKFASKFDEVVGLKTAAFEAMYEYKKRCK